MPGPIAPVPVVPVVPVVPAVPVVPVVPPAAPPKPPPVPWSPRVRAFVFLGFVAAGLAISNGVLIYQLSPFALAGWVVVLLFFCISGAFGGILALASRDNDGEPVDLTDPKTLFVALLGGIGGAIAGLGFMVADKQVDP